MVYHTRSILMLLLMLLLLPLPRHSRPNLTSNDHQSTENNNNKYDTSIAKKLAAPATSCIQHSIPHPPTLNSISFAQYPFPTHTRHINQHRREAGRARAAPRAHAPPRPRLCPAACPTRRCGGRWWCVLSTCVHAWTDKDRQHLCRPIHPSTTTSRHNTTPRQQHNKQPPTHSPTHPLLPPFHHHHHHHHQPPTPHQ